MYQDHMRPSESFKSQPLLQKTDLDSTILSLTMDRSSGENPSPRHSCGVSAVPDGSAMSAMADVPSYGRCAQL